MNEHDFRILIHRPIFLRFLQLRPGPVSSEWPPNVNLWVAGARFFVDRMPLLSSNVRAQMANTNE